MFRSRSKSGNGNGNGAGKSVSSSMLLQFLSGKGPVTAEDLKRSADTDRRERARMILRLREQPEFHALIFEVLEAAEMAERSGEGKFAGADEMMGAMGVIFRMAESRLPSDDAKRSAQETRAAAFWRRAVQSVWGTKGNRPWRNMTDRPKDRWLELIEEQEKLASRERV